MSILVICNLLIMLGQHRGIGYSLQLWDLIIWIDGIFIRLRLFWS